MRGVSGAALESGLVAGNIGIGDVVLNASSGIGVRAGSGQIAVASVASGEYDVAVDGIIRFVPGVSFNLEGPAPFLSMFEVAASTPSMIAGQGLFWIRDDAAQSPMFTDDTNVDHDLLSGRIVAITHYTSGAAAAHAFNARTTLIVVECQGGGSGGYGCPAATAGNLIAASGGAGGGYVKAVHVFASPGPANATYTVGAGGAGGAGASPSDPGDGGDTTFALSGGVNVITAGGGTATSQAPMANGATVTASTAQQSGGGVATTGGSWAYRVNIDGHGGGFGVRYSGTVGLSGRGGASGSGSMGGRERSTGGGGLGPLGTPLGVGGGGGISVGGTARAGAPGTGGWITVWEYEF
jgi:hypothetical protein